MPALFLPMAFVPKQGIKKPLSMSDYVIDLNFDILEGANEANEFMVRIEIDINTLLMENFSAT
jgi:hypothetical protein